MLCSPSRDSSFQHLPPNRNPKNLIVDYFSTLPNVSIILLARRLLFRRYPDIVTVKGSSGWWRVVASQRACTVFAPQSQPLLQSTLPRSRPANLTCNNVVLGGRTEVARISAWHRSWAQAHPPWLEGLQKACGVTAFLRCLTIITETKAIAPTTAATKIPGGGNGLPSSAGGTPENEAVAFKAAKSALLG